MRRAPSTHNLEKRKFSVCCSINQEQQEEGPVPGNVPMGSPSLMTAMGDALRPSDGEFRRVLHESFRRWPSYFDEAQESALLYHCVNLKNILGPTPAFLAHGTAVHNENLAFACEVKDTQQGKTSLWVKGQSKWRTSHGPCNLEPRILPKQLLLGVQNRLKVDFSKDAPFSNWPGVQGLPDCDEGNYIGVLFLAWAYVLSARWTELLEISSGHDCHLDITPRDERPSEEPDCVIAIDIGEDPSEEEAFWWDTVLRPGEGWKAAVDYKGKEFFSPWSITNAAPTKLRVSKGSSLSRVQPPSSDAALEYLAQFCTRHHLYDQLPAALAAALFIPFMGSRSVSLPPPSPTTQPGPRGNSPNRPSRTPEITAEYQKLLPCYMTLSTNTWGMRSLLYSTFFNPNIECNLVSAWLNPAFAIIDSTIQEDNPIKLLNGLAKRQPRLASLWLGAFLTGCAKSVLRSIRTGMTAIDLHAAALTGITQTFLTKSLGKSDGETIRREDEARLLFITACDGYTRVPIQPYKPFGMTSLCDAELQVQKHAQCGCHCLQYDSWNWEFTDGRVVESAGLQSDLPSSKNSTTESTDMNSVRMIDYTYDFNSEALSELATRGIFGWLRSTGYPLSEKPIYQHSWIDLDGSEEELSDRPSDTVERLSPKNGLVKNWLLSLES